MILVEPFRTQIAQYLGKFGAPWNSGGYAWILYQNDVPEGPDVTLGDLVEANFQGYNPLGLSNFNWLFAQNPADLTYVLRPGVSNGFGVGGFWFQVTGTLNLPQTIYGAAMVDGLHTFLNCMERFETPLTLTSVGQIVSRCQPTLTVSKDVFLPVPSIGDTGN